MTDRRLWHFASTLSALLLLLPVGTQAQNGKKERTLTPVTAERLLKGTNETTSWLMYGGNYENWRFSPLTDVDRKNVKKLQVEWIFQTGIPGQLEAAPIVADGIMYLPASYNHLYALDAVTGEPLWKYDHPLPDDLRIC
ncbi:MAG: PQQ-binding-like beta-propeller repeat protein, partial [Deltaproteobacteria bacterium]|nr:PQQ-binding-like beta-propeller repeat protein [Deltaproteobacteria bacterium]